VRRERLGTFTGGPVHSTSVNMTSKVEDAAVTTRANSSSCAKTALAWRLGFELGGSCWTSAGMVVPSANSGETSSWCEWGACTRTPPALGCDS